MRGIAHTISFGGALVRLRNNLIFFWCRNTTDERVKLSWTEDGETNRPDNWHGQGRKAA